VKRNIGPDDGPAVSEGVPNGKGWLGASTITIDRTVVLDNRDTHPSCAVQISDLTVPLSAGQMKIVGTAGRVELFDKRQGTGTAPMA